MAQLKNRLLPQVGTDCDSVGESLFGHPRSQWVPLVLSGVEGQNCTQKYPWQEQKYLGSPCHAGRGLLHHQGITY